MGLYGFAWNSRGRIHHPLGSRILSYGYVTDTMTRAALFALWVAEHLGRPSNHMIGHRNYAVVGLFGNRY